MNTKKMLERHGKKKKGVVWWAQMAPPAVLRRGRRKIINENNDNKYVPDKAGISDSAHMQRDATCALDLYSVISEEYEYRGTLLNLPAREYGYDPPSSLPLDKLEGVDLILMSTRPALDDDPDNDKKAVVRSDSLFERLLYNKDNLGVFFEQCTRQNVILSDKVIDKVKVENNRIYRGCTFDVNKDAYLKNHGDTKQPVEIEAKKSSVVEQKIMIGYICYLNTIDFGPDYGKGPALLSVFGMSGTSTLLLTNLIRSKRANLDLLQNIVHGTKLKFVMIAFSPHFPSDLPFRVDDFEVQNPKKIIEVEFNRK